VGWLIGSEHSTDRVLVRRDVSFIYLAGGGKPDYRTLARFPAATRVIKGYSKRRCYYVPVGDGEFGPYCTGWDQTKSQRLQAQGDELWPDEARRGKAGKGDRRTDAAGRVVDAEEDKELALITTI